MTRAPFDPVEAAYAYLIANGHPDADRNTVARLWRESPVRGVVSRYSRKRQTDYLVSTYRRTVHTPDPSLTGRVFVTPSGRRWECLAPHRMDPKGERCLQPLGTDTYDGGGVRRLYVDEARLDGTDKVWKPADA